MSEFDTNNLSNFIQSAIQTAQAVANGESPFENEQEQIRRILQADKETRRKYFNAILSGKGADVIKNGYFDIRSIEDQDSQDALTSLLGTPINMPVSIDHYLLPNEPLVTIIGEKRIIKTAITGVHSTATAVRRGTIKELINTNDYQVKIVGRVVDESGNDVYPEEVITQLKEVYEKRKTVKISSLITDLFDIKQIAIYKINLPGEAGRLNNQQYEILAYSDETVERDKITLGVEVDDEEEVEPNDDNSQS